MFRSIACTSTRRLSTYCSIRDMYKASSTIGNAAAQSTNSSKNSNSIFTASSNIPTSQRDRVSKPLIICTDNEDVETVQEHIKL
ncbi:hypothetical protein RNJ44_00251 [Nakaseomyces bracarensis]|uniref:Uncharacterized protein n=1 Tax=Nakaseomyces bracarensis TaxID=273131 RepID=A0ABR4NTD3_9SACH